MSARSCQHWNPPRFIDSSDYRGQSISGSPPTYRPKVSELALRIRYTIIQRTIRRDYIVGASQTSRINYGSLKSIGARDIFLKFESFGFGFLGLGFLDLGSLGLSFLDLTFLGLGFFGFFRIFGLRVFGLGFFRFGFFGSTFLDFLGLGFFLGFLGLGFLDCGS